MRSILLACLLLASCARHPRTLPPGMPVANVTYWACESGERPDVVNCRYVTEDRQSINFRHTQIRVK